MVYIAHKKQGTKKWDKHRSGRSYETPERIIVAAGSIYSCGYAAALHRKQCTPPRPYRRLHKKR